MRKGNVTILASVLAIALVAAGVGMGTMAYFSDVATSTDNVFTAGTYDIQLDGASYADHVSGTWTAPNWAPGMEETATLNIKNTGSLNVATIKIKPTGLINPDGLASRIIIKEVEIFKPETVPTGGKTMTFTGAFLVSWGIWGPNDGVLTLADFASGPYYLVTGSEDGTILPNQVAYVKMVLQFDPDAENDAQGDTCSFTLTIKAQQGPEDHVVVGDCGYGT